MLSYGRQCITEADIDAVVAVLRGDYLTQGPTIGHFEAAFSRYIGSSHAIAVANGTAALHLACSALGLGKGDGAIVPATTFAATSNAVLYGGATPVFADVDPLSGNLSLKSLEAAYVLATERGLTVKAVLPVHFAGLPCDMGEIWGFARDHNISVIEDACHSLGAEYRCRVADDFAKVGSSPLSTMTVFSFHPVKHITTGEGGLITTEDKVLSERLQRLRSHGITKDPEQYIAKDRAYDGDTGALNPWYHEMQELGFNYRLCDIQAALGLSQIARIGEFVSRRRELASLYRKHLGNHRWLEIPPAEAALQRHSYHLFPVLIDFKSLGKSRRQVMTELGDAGVGTQVHYMPVQRHPYYEQNRSRWLSTPIPNADKFYEAELSIPMYPSMTDNDAMKVVDALASVLNH